MNFKELTTWVEAHPGESVVIGGVGLIAVLWLLGFFSSSGGGQAQDPLAAAYYAAEAQQAVVGGQIQMANINATASTAQKGIEANAAVAIDATNAGAAMTINGQNASTASTINQAQVDAAQAINASQVGGAVSINTAMYNAATALGLNSSNNQLLATYSNNQTAQTVNAANNAAFVASNHDNNLTSQYATFVGGIMPFEFARVGGGGINVDTPLGSQWFSGAASPANTPLGLLESGYSLADAMRLANPPGSPPA